MHLAKSDSFDTCEDENLRVMHCTSESTIAQMIGLSYSSMVDPTWHRGRDYSIILDEQGSVTCNVVFRYQCLPLGTTPSTAVKVNVRFDVCNFPVNGDKIHEFVHTSHSDIDKMREHAQICKLSEDLEVEVVSPYRCFANTAFGCMRFTNKANGKQHISTMVVASGCKTICSRAFPLESSNGSAEERDDIGVKVHVSSTLGSLNTQVNGTEEGEKQSDEVIMCVGGTVLERKLCYRVYRSALFIRDGPEFTESCNITSIGTTPAQSLHGA